MKKTKPINESTFGMYGGGLDNTASAATYTVQGKSPGYVYSILPFNDTLQQKVNQATDDYYIYPGCTVRGVGVNNPDKHYTGIVNRIVKDENGEIKFIYIKTLKTNRFVTILANDELELILHQPAQNNSKYNNKYGSNFSPNYNMKL